MTNAIDPTIARTIEEADAEAELEALMRNRPQFYESGGSTDSAIEEGNVRGVVSTGALITLWNIETGEPSQVLYDALKARRMQRFPDDHPNPQFRGQRVYALKKEEVPEPIRGELFCPLSYEHPSEEALALGFGRGDRGCSKPGYYLSQYDIDLHVEKSHKRFYRLREERRAAEREKQASERQEQQLQAILAMAGGNQRRTRKGDPDAGEG